MAGSWPVIFVRVVPGSSPRRLVLLLRWLRALAPAAFLVVGGVAPPTTDGAAMVTFDADGAYTPAELADAILKARFG